MDENKTILQRQSKSGATQCGWHLLSPALLEKARQRVKVVAWLMFGIMAIGAFLDLTYIKVVLGDLGVGLILGAIFAVSTAVALLMAAYNSRLQHITVLHLALSYEIIACLFLAILMPWFTYTLFGYFPLVTWVTPLIILFPLIVPSPPGVTLVTAVLATATRPLGMILIDTFSTINVDTLSVVRSLWSPAFAVAVAYAGSRVVHGMSVDLANAQRMGSYQLDSLLGSGGMGEVWLAKHQLLARPAAVKLINPDSLASNPETQRVAVARFEREAQATASLRSPHTIQLYDFGTAQSGSFYYVMEYLNGLDLEELVKRFGPIPPARLVNLLLQACDSLGEAHECGLIHRDIKPANIYVCRYGRHSDFVKVLDFGLVKSDNDRDEEVNLTAEGTVSGTPAFVSPEQVLGDPTDARTDIYSLGCTAYWALTGSYVFQGKSAMATVMMHVNTPPTPPSSCDVQPITQELDRVVMACLEKDPAKRPQDVDQLAALLSTCINGDTWSQNSAWEWWNTHLPR